MEWHRPDKMRTHSAGSAPPEPYLANPLRPNVLIPYSSWYKMYSPDANPSPTFAIPITSKTAYIAVHHSPLSFCMLTVGTASFLHFFSNHPTSCSMPVSKPVPETAASSFDINFRKRFQSSAREAHPLIALNREGMICSMTRAAQHLLEYSSEADIDACFFAHVHKRNMHRVMRELADMVARGKKQAKWLLRLRTGNDRWRWYHVSVQNHLGDETERIYARLRPL